VTIPAPRKSRIVAALLGAGLAPGISACKGGESDPSPSPRVAHATSVDLPSYCEIQGLRKMIADDKVDPAALPSFADRTEVDGTPLVVDFKKTVPSEGHAALLDRLFASPGLTDIQVPQRDVLDCIDTTTEADVKRTQGGPGYLANPSAEPTK
jgi:hypothetical protein